MNSKCGQAVEIYNDGMVIPVINYLLCDLEGGPIDEKLDYDTNGGNEAK
jgi:hypothetical protein